MELSIFRYKMFYGWTHNQWFRTLFRAPWFPLCESLFRVTLSSFELSSCVSNVWGIQNESNNIQTLVLRGIYIFSMGEMRKCMESI